jgi:hypothetical protein
LKEGPTVFTWWVVWKVIVTTAGNLRARKRVGQVAVLLDSVGLGVDRVAMYNLSSSEAPRFVEIAVEMTERISALGPNPIRLARRKKVDSKDQAVVVWPTISKVG